MIFLSFFILLLYFFVFENIRVFVWDFVCIKIYLTFRETYWWFKTELYLINLNIVRYLIVIPEEAFFFGRELPLKYFMLDFCHWYFKMFVFWSPVTYSLNKCGFCLVQLFTNIKFLWLMKIENIFYVIHY